MKLKRFRRPIKTRAEINVTPLIDVMFVLLVIFMVTTPMMHSNVSVNLPKVGPSVVEKNQSVPLTIFIQSDGVITFQEKQVNHETLLEQLNILSPDQQETIYIKADKSLLYEDLVQLMVSLSQSGFSKLMLVTEANDKVAKKNRIHKEKKHL